MKVITEVIKGYRLSTANGSNQLLQNDLGRNKKSYNLLYIPVIFQLPNPLRWLRRAVASDVAN